MTHEGQDLVKTAAKVEIDGEVAARKAGSDASQKAMQEINQEMARLSPEERLKVAKKVEEINAARIENNGDLPIPKAKVGYTPDGKDVAFLEFDPPTSAKVKESIALTLGATNGHGGRMRDTVVYQNPTEIKRMEEDAMSGSRGVYAAQRVIEKKLEKGGINPQ